LAADDDDRFRISALAARATFWDATESREPRAALFRFSRGRATSVERGAAMNALISRVPRLRARFIERIGGSHSLAADEPRLSFYESVSVDVVAYARHTYE